MLAFLIYFIITVATTPVGTSHLSHVGGFVTGLFPAMMFLPHLKSQKCGSLQLNRLKMVVHDIDLLYTSAYTIHMVADIRVYTS